MMIDCVLFFLLELFFSPSDDNVSTLGKLFCQIRKKESNFFDRNRAHEIILSLWIERERMSQTWKIHKNVYISDLTSCLWQLFLTNTRLNSATTLLSCKKNFYVKICQKLFSFSFLYFRHSPTHVERFSKPDHNDGSLLHNHNEIY